MKQRTLILAVALALSTGAAHAAAPYAGAMLGQSKVKDTTQVAGYTMDDTATSFGFFVGSEIVPHVAAEFGYIDFGKYNLGGPSLTGDVKASAFYLAAVGTAPITPSLSVYGKLGLARSKTDGEISTTTGIHWSGSDTATKPMLAVGLEFPIVPKVAIRAEYSKFKDVGGNNNGKSDIDTLAVAGVVRF